MKKVTIDDIVLTAFKEMDIVFRGSTLLETVKNHPRTAQTYDSTILRSLRKLRSRGLINYEPADHNKSIYRKKKVITKISDCFPSVNEVLDVVKSVSKQFNQV